jgi:hypothetical protein
MIIIGCVVLIIFALFFIFFVLPTFSPIPYFPSNHKDNKLILKALDIKHHDLLIDIGAGDGWIIFEAAKYAYAQKLKTKFVAMEINPILIILMSILRFFHPNKHNIQILKKDMFTFDYKKYIGKQKTLIYLYISPWYIEKVMKQIGNGKNISFVSYLYPIKSRKAKRRSKGIHDVFMY